MQLHLKHRILILIAGVCTSLFSQYYPYKDSTDYRERYRGQYHFSPQSEWMNDINGLVYQGGKYHMIYQWGKSIRHGGYSSSRDLLHWKDEGVALIPKNTFLKGAVQNASGDEIYSGSAVVVNGEVAKKITGSIKEAIVAIYTGTGAGTCLAWSNDTGRIWHDYVKNPVAHFTKKDYPRDPCVKWHQETGKYVMALFQHGTTFYGSKDLVTWDSLSNIRFGFECPDFFQLWVDGDKAKKRWVLQDANGSYLVGDFDGTHFIPLKDQAVQIMDVGPDFYAAQSFSPGNLPNKDARVIQIAWMDHWNGGIGEQGWERNATFPVSLGLISYRGQIKITRTPIKEISDLYSSSKRWEKQLIKLGTNLLSECRSKTFDLYLKVNLNYTKASEWGINIAGKKIEYNSVQKILLGKELVPDKEGIITIRILADWGQLEVFGNEGVFSYTEEYAFPQERNDITFYGDADVQLMEMEFHELKRIW